MKTVQTNDAELAANVIKRGGLVAFPTETVYGLGADVFNEAALHNVFIAKKRPPDNPLIVHIASIEQVKILASKIPAAARLFFEAFFPGPLTVVLPRAERVPSIAAAGLETVGVRMPRNPLAAAFLRFCAVPVAAPSANLSGRPSPTTWQAVIEDLDGRIDCVLRGDAAEIGLESTVVDCTSDTPQVLRPGAISIEDLRLVVPQTRIYKSVESTVIRSPGMKHGHYSPHARVVILGGKTAIPREDSSAFIGLAPPAGKFEQVRICSSVEAYANALFEFFRECDRSGIRVIYCEAVAPKGIGAALTDRLRRAAKG